MDMTTTEQQKFIRKLVLLTVIPALTVIITVGGLALRFYYVVPNMIENNASAIQRNAQMVNDNCVELDALPDKYVTLKELALTLAPIGLVNLQQDEAIKEIKNKLNARSYRSRTNINTE